MAAKGYCTIQDVADFLQRTLSSNEEAQCSTLIERLETFIDEETGRGWLVGAQTNEVHYVTSQNILLKYAPVATISSIVGRSALGEAEAALVVDVDYEVIDLAIGRVRLVYPGSYDRIRVTYTPVGTVPGDLVQAFVETVATRLAPTLSPGTYGLDSYSLPDLTVRFSRNHVQEIAPAFPQHIIDRYRYGVHA